MNELGIDSILVILKKLGITDKQFEIYLFLTKTSSCKAIEISRALKIDRAQVYEILKELQKKGLVESTLERPALFRAVPFEDVLDMFIEERKREAEALEREKEKLLNKWRSMEVVKPEEEAGRFAVLEGRSNIYSKISQMITNAEKEFIVVTTGLGVMRAELAGLFIIADARKIGYRALTNITPENIEIIEKALASHPNFAVKHIDFGTKFIPRLAVADDKEAMVFITPKEDKSITNQEDTGLWTNNKAFVKTLKLFFEQLWKTSSDSRVKH